LVGSVGKVTATSVSKPILWLTAKCSSTDYSHISHPEITGSRYS